jgi:CheY-like chemotaxis protein
MQLDKPDLLILDADMPGMSGYDVMQAMREDSELQSVRVILLARPGDEGPPDAPKPYRRVSKPFNPSKLLPGDPSDPRKK